MPRMNAVCLASDIVVRATRYHNPSALRRSIENSQRNGRTTTCRGSPHRELAASVVPSRLLMFLKTPFRTWGGPRDGRVPSGLGAPHAPSALHITHTYQLSVGFVLGGAGGTVGTRNGVGSVLGAWGVNCLAAAQDRPFVGCPSDGTW